MNSVADVDEENDCSGRRRRRREKREDMEDGGGGQKVRKAEILPNTNGTLRTGK